MDKWDKARNGGALNLLLHLITQPELKRVNIETIISVPDSDLYIFGKCKCAKWTLGPQAPLKLKSKNVFSPLLPDSDFLNFATWALTSSHFSYWVSKISMPFSRFLMDLGVGWNVAAPLTIVISLVMTYILVASAEPKMHMYNHA